MIPVNDPTVLSTDKYSETMSVYHILITVYNPTMLGTDKYSETISVHHIVIPVYNPPKVSRNQTLNTLEGPNTVKCNFIILMS